MSIKYNGNSKIIKSLVDAINNEGSGGGESVTITPTISSGTKIADYAIGGVAGSLYAPIGSTSIRIGTSNPPSEGTDGDIFIQYESGRPRITKVTWIQSDAGKDAYIDIGIIPTTTTRTNLVYRSYVDTGSLIYGTRGSGESLAYRFFGYNGNFYWDCGSGDGGNRKIGTPTGGTTGKTWNLLLGNGFIRDLDTDTDVISASPVLIDDLSRYPINIGCKDEDLRIYSCKIWDGAVLVFDGVPCHSSEGECGLYDKVTRTAFLSSGDDILTGVGMTTEILEEPEKVVAAYVRINGRWIDIP